jgi:hypothetical protein
VPRIAQGTVVFAVELNARGDENGASFSLNFDPRELAFVSAQSGSGLAINVNARRLASALGDLPGDGGSLAWEMIADRAHEGAYCRRVWFTFERAVENEVAPSSGLNG